MPDRKLRIRRRAAGGALAAWAGAAVAGAALLACGAAPSAPSVGPGHSAAADGDPRHAAGSQASPEAASGQAARSSQEEILAAIQKAMNELDKAAQQCWAVAATERFDIAGEIALQIDIAAPPAPASASVIRDTAKNAKLSACLVQLMAGYRWAPPLYGQAIQLPFRFRAPDGQNTIDRALVAWNGQGPVSVAVLLDEANTGSAAASMFELAVAAGGTTGMRRAERAELWYFLGAGRVGLPGGGGQPVAAGDLMYVPRGGAREIEAVGDDLHAVVVMVPGGREGAARAGALPTPALDAGAPRPRRPKILSASARDPEHQPAVFLDEAQIPAWTFRASVERWPAGTQIAEPVQADAELLYVLDGGGTLTVNGVALPVTATSVVQLPKNTQHAFVATSAVRAVRIFTRAGPEPRAKAHP